MEIILSEKAQKDIGHWKKTNNTKIQEEIKECNNFKSLSGNGKS